MEEQLTQTGEEQVSPASDVSELPEDTGVQELEPPSNEEAELSKSADEYEREITGKQAALEAERERRQAAEYRLRMMEQEVQSRQQTQEAKYDPEDYLLYKDVEKIIEERINRIESSRKESDLQRSLRDARQKYDDFDDVFRLADELSKEDPWMVEYVRNSVNPGEAAYRLGMTHPNFNKSLANKTAKTVANKINQNASRPRTLSEAGANAPSPKKKFELMTDDELEAEIARTKGLI